MIEDGFYDSKVGIVGAGNIGLALGLKLLDKGFLKENLMISYNGSIFTFSNLYDNDLVDQIADNSRIVEECDVIILAVPPQKFSQIGEFNLDEDKLVISFMAGVGIDTIRKQTGSDNVVRIIPTGPDTILDSTAICGVYPAGVCDDIFEFMDFDVYHVDNEDMLGYMIVAGCLPAVFCKTSYEDNICDIDRFSENFPQFREVARKASLLVPGDNVDEFVKSFATPGGITQKIIDSIESKNSLYRALLDGFEYNKQLEKKIQYPRVDSE